MSAKTTTLFNPYNFVRNSGKSLSSLSRVNSNISPGNKKVTGKVTDPDHTYFESGGGRSCSGGRTGTLRGHTSPGSSDVLRGYDRGGPASGRTADGI